MNNKILVLLFVGATIFLSGCITQSEQRTSEEVFGSTEVTPKPNPTEILEYKYSISIGSAGQVAYNRYIPQFCTVAMGSAGQKSTQGNCDEKDYNIIDNELKNSVKEQPQSATQYEPYYQSNNNLGIFDNANRLNNDYNWKIRLVNEIQQRCDALGTSVTRDCYVEWINRNNNAISSGEELSTYLTENRKILDNQGTVRNWASDIITLVAQNRVTYERDNQILNQAISKMR